MLWDNQISVYSGIGYNNNVLLSPVNPQGSAFSKNGVDLVLLRLPLDGWEIVGSLIGDDIRYWHDTGTSREDTFLGSLRVQRDLSDGWQTGLAVRGLYEDQVLDVTTSLATPTNALVEGVGLTAQPYLRKNFDIGLWLLLEIPVTRWYFRSPLDDYWDWGPVVTAGYDFGRHNDVSVSYAAAYQPHDSWVALSASGFPQPQLLQIFQQKAELAWHQYWDTKQRWRSSTRLVYTTTQDNGGGYFNYNEYELVQDLRWKTDDWEINASAQLAYEHYPVQGIGILNGQTLYRNLLNCSIEVERRLYKGLKCYVESAYERTLSNEANNSDSYDGTTVCGGLRYEF